MDKPKIVSLFSGAGGIDVGFKRAGFDTVFATDIWQVACDTLSKNFPNSTIVCDSVENIDFESLKIKFPNISGVVGGPPCPPFSKSRFYRTEKKRGLNDETGFLTVSNFFRAVEEIKPDFFFFENVHGFTYKPHKSALDFLKSESSRLGFKIWHKVLNAADYGVPQKRERFICVGFRDSNVEFSFPTQTHINPDKISDIIIDNIKPWRTAGDVLSDIDFDLPEDHLLRAGSKDHELLKQIPPGDNYLFFTKERGHPRPQFKWRSRYWSFLLKLSPEKPSWTIQASFSNNMGPFHWKNRFLRISEIKRLQSFSDEYELHGNFKDQWRQVGNAVPPELVHIIAKQIYKKVT